MEGGPLHEKVDCNMDWKAKTPNNNNNNNKHKFRLTFTSARIIRQRDANSTHPHCFQKTRFTQGIERVAWHTGNIVDDKVIPTQRYRTQSDQVVALTL